MASEQHRSKGLPPVAVHVLWHPHQPFSRRRVQELATDLADLVQEHLPDLGHEAAIRHRSHPGWRSLPQEVASLRVDRRINFSKNLWTSVRGAFVPTLAPPELQQIMRNKDAKVPSYRQQCQEVWLLIVGRGFEPSTFGDLGPEVEAHEFERSFDRVFFLHHADELVRRTRRRTTYTSAVLASRACSRTVRRTNLAHSGAGWSSLVARRAHNPKVALLLTSFHIPHPLLWYNARRRVRWAAKGAPSFMASYIHAFAASGPEWALYVVSLLVSVLPDGLLLVQRRGFGRGGVGFGRRRGSFGLFRILFALLFTTLLGPIVLVALVAFVAYRFFASRRRG